MPRLPTGYAIRLAIIRSVHRTFVECEYTDRQGERTIQCPIPHPYAGRGGGIFVGFEKDVRVLVAMAPSEQPYIIGIVPDRSLYFQQDGVPNAPLFGTEYPEVERGEIRFSGPTGSRIDLLSDGNIAIDAGIGNDAADIELSNITGSLFIRTNNICQFTEAGRHIESVIRRDLNEEEDQDDTDTFDFLTGEVYDSILSDIGRSPIDEVQLRTSQISRSVVRNPALVEKRDITYEYANSFNVGNLTKEAQAMTAVTSANVNETIKYIQTDRSMREHRRTDVFDLNLRNYNHLMEKIEGTVVDVYGNVLDINRHIIKVPEVEEIDTKNNSIAEHGLRRMYSYLRRSIKYHFEINSRKETSAIDPSTTNPAYNAKDHSRWSLDVDGEGLTKINIPASSETGNIPVLSRYIVSRDENNPDDGRYRENNRHDVKILQFGAKDGNNFSGQTIDNAEYLPETVDGKSVTAGTAFHDLMNIASSILEEGKLRDPKAEGGTAVPSMTDKINNKIPEMTGQTFQPTANENANAGGRSLHANLDGSIEMSIGADTADRKSLVLDLAGGVIAHYGRDRNGRSIIHQTDGDVIIQVGGPGITDDRFKESDNSDTEDRPGRVEIHLNRPGSSATNQKIIIDENGITIDIIGNGIFQASGDLTITAGGKLLLNGERVFTHGSVDSSVDSDRAIKGGEREVSRSGRKL